MSELPPATQNQQQAAATKARKQVTKKLSTGQKISLSTQDERTLRSIYEFLAGYHSRRAIESSIEAKRSEVSKLHNDLPPSSRLLLQMQPRIHLSANNPERSDNDEEKNVTKTETDLLLDEYYKAKDQLLKLEEKLKLHIAMDHKIGFKDLDAVLKSLGPAFHRKQIEVRLN